MTNSESPRAHEAILDSLLEQLDGDNLYRLVDAPVAAAAGAFTGTPAGPLAQAPLLPILGEFVAHLYAHAVRPVQMLTPAQAQAEALNLLERHYRGASGHGYYAALLEASDSARNGVAAILSDVADIIRGIERRKHVESVLDSAVDPGDWPAHCALARLLLERFATSWPPALLRYAPRHLAGEWRHLLLAYLETSAALRGILRGPGVAERR